VSTINVIHLSDIHIAKKSYADQKVVIEALQRDIETQRIVLGGYHLMLLSGDLIAKGDYSEENVHLFEEGFLRPVLNAAQLGTDALVICPGNHDLQTSLIPDLVRPVFDSLNTTDLVNDAIGQLGDLPFLTSGLKAFNGLVKRTVTTKCALKNDLFSAYELLAGGITVGICALNSAWKATGKPNDADYGHLIIGQRQIELAYEAIRQCEIKIAVFHHPIPWLAPFDASELDVLLYKRFDGIFYGHNHNPDSQLCATISGPLFVSNAGCIFQRRKYYNGYNIVLLQPSPRSWTVLAREYQDVRQEFSPSMRVSDTGRIEFEVPHSQPNGAIRSIPSAEYIASVEDAANGHLLSATISDIAPHKLVSLYVEPRLYRVSERQFAQDSGSSNEQLSLLSIIDKNQYAIFLGRKESGRTTLLHKICTEAGTLTFPGGPKYGAYVNLLDIKRNPHSIFQHLISFSRGACTRKEFEDILSDGRAVICMDNLSLEDDDLRDQIITFFNRYPKNRFYFASVEDVQSSLGEKIELGFDATVNVFYIHSFSRRQTRQLVSNWFGGQKLGVERKVDALLASLKRLNVPRTPFLISILLWIQERNVSFSPVNQAEVLDILIDGLLEKLHEKKLREDMDANIKRHFLMELAYAMYLQERFIFSNNEIESFAVDYFARKKLLSASSDFLRELEGAGVLIRFEGGVGYKFDCLRSYFLSLKLAESDSFLEEALSRKGMVSLGRELDYFTGRVRNRADVLERAVNSVREIFSDLKVVIPLDVFDHLTADGSPFSSEQNPAAHGGILEHHVSVEEREELLDQFDDHAHGEQAVRPKPATLDIQSEFVEALIVASAIVRNSELIDDGKLKEESYRFVIRMWAHVMLRWLAVMEVKEDLFRGKALEEAFSDLPKDFAIYMIKMCVPMVVSSLVMEHVGTQKLQVVVRESVGNGAENAAKLLDTMLYADLELPDRFKLFRNIVDDAAISKFELEVIFVKLMHFFILRPLKESEFLILKSLIADVFTRMTSVSDRHKREYVKSMLMQYLEKGGKRAPDTSSFTQRIPKKLTRGKRRKR